LKSQYIELQTHIQAQPQHIYARLAHPTYLPTLHPYIRSVAVQQEGHLANGSRYFEFWADEYFRLLNLFPMTNRIQSRMILVQPPYEWSQIGQTRLNIVLDQTIRLTAQPHATLVTNHLSYTAPGWATGYVARQIRWAHGRFMDNLKAQAEGTTQ
jgi:hypothetical protein